MKRTAMSPEIIIHSDWSTARDKRWLAEAARVAGGTYRITRVGRVENASRMVADATGKADGGGALLGFDFPIGLPAAYARRAGITDFRAALVEFGEGQWSSFYKLAERADEISVTRPFYPARPGGTLRRHLHDGLGAQHPLDLLRQCDRADSHRNNACAIFWTLGGNQVGRAAIAGWQEIVAPAVRTGAAAIWPFHGRLPDLLQQHACTIAETYPTDACVQLGLPAPGRGWSKTKRDHRLVQIETLRRWMTNNGVEVSLDVEPLIDDGFGSLKTGEDAFDAFVGLLAMINVVLGHRVPGEPVSPDVKNVEGWILGHQR